LCSEHPENPNEFYDKRKNKALCTICAVNLAWGSKKDKNEIIVPLNS
jgi:hypothetical protein